MYVEKDYIMRIIHEVIRTLFKLLCNIDIDKDEEAQIPAEIEEPYKKLRSMIEDGRINEAENQLTDLFDANRHQDFLLALLFYEYLNKKGDDYLEKNNYSRQEIADGLKYVINAYGYGGMAEAFMEEL